MYIMCLRQLPWLLKLSSMTNFKLQSLLEDTARYAGYILAPAEGFGLWLFLQILGHFWRSVVPLVTLGSNLYNFG